MAHLAPWIGTLGVPAIVAPSGGASYSVTSGPAAGGYCGKAVTRNDRPTYPGHTIPPSPPRRPPHAGCSPMTWQGHPRTSTTSHRKWSRAILRRDPICRCQGCKHHDGPCTQPSEEADHIIPWAEGGPLDMNNGQGICCPCHSQKTACEALTARTRYPRNRPSEPHPGLR